MSKIVVIKTFYVFQSSGNLTEKWIIFHINKYNKKTLKERIIQCKKEAENVFEGFKDIFPKAKTLYIDKTKCEKTIHKYKILSEEIKNEIIKLNE